MIYFLPWGDRNTASSRLRVFNIIPYLDNAVVGTPDMLPIYDMQNGSKSYTKNDVLVIQKRPDIEEMRKAKKAGAMVIYDIDDLYWDRPEYKSMLDEADHITVDTEEKKRMIGRKNVTVIPDSLDWDGTVKEYYGDGKVFGWTGYGNNTHYLNDIDLPEGYVWRFVASPDWYKHYKDYTPQCRPWSLDMVDKYLSECDFGAYYLPDGEFEQCKGMHKLLKNWAIGLPTYTSPMPDYVKAMQEAGVGEKYLVRKKSDWKKLKPEYDPEDVEKCRAYALKYEAKNTAELWEKVIKTK